MTSTIVSIAPSRTIFEVFDVEEYRYLEILVSRSLILRFMHDLYVVEIYRPGTIFLALIEWVYLNSQHFGNKPRKTLRRLRWCVTVVQGHLRSSILVLIETPYLTSYKSSVVTISYLLSLPRQQFIGRRSLFFAVFTHSNLIWSPHKGFPWIYYRKVGIKKLESMGYTMAKTAWSYVY